MPAIIKEKKEKRRKEGLGLKGQMDLEGDGVGWSGTGRQHLDEQTGGGRGKRAATVARCHPSSFLSEDGAHSSPNLGSPFTASSTVPCRAP